MSEVFADLVFTGGPVLCMDGARSRASALAVRGGRIAAVRPGVGDPVGPGTEVWTSPDGRCCRDPRTPMSTPCWHDDTGTLDVGRRADLVVLDRDPFDGPPEEIGATRAALTYVDGALVYAR